MARVRDSAAQDGGKALIHAFYFDRGTALGWEMRRIAAYLTGPFRLAMLLQDPGSPHTAGSGAQATREVGVRNNDPTARFIGNALAAVGIPEHEALLLNALPGFGMKPNKASLRAGAALNSEVMRMAGITSLLVCGRQAQRAIPFLEVPGLTFRATHHPSIRGHNATPNGRERWMHALRSLLHVESGAEA